MRNESPVPYPGTLRDLFSVCLYRSLVCVCLTGLSLYPPACLLAYLDLPDLPDLTDLCILSVATSVWLRVSGYERLFIVFYFYLCQLLVVSEWVSDYGGQGTEYRVGRFRRNL